MAVMSAQAQLFRKSEQKSVEGIEIHFRLDKHYLDLKYMGNEESLREFAHWIDSIGLQRIIARRPLCTQLMAVGESC